MSAHSQPVLQAEPTVSLVDGPLLVRAFGLVPHSEVTIEAEAVDSGRKWRSSAEYPADENGSVDLSRDAPIRGSYEGVDPLGVIWSMEATDGDEGEPFPITSFQIEFRLCIQGDVAATATVRRNLGTADMPPVRLLDPSECGLVGGFYLPSGDPPAAGMLVLGGTESAPPYGRANLLAAHGYATLALRYFGVPPLPRALEHVPLEYAERALGWLGCQERVIASKIGVLGVSRGGELALLVGATYPEKVRAVVSYAGSSVVRSRYGGSRSGLGSAKSAWTSEGKELPFVGGRSASLRRLRQAWRTRVVDSEGRLIQAAIEEFQLADTRAAERAAIPVERSAGPILFVSGGDDHVTLSARHGDSVMSRLRRSGHPFPSEHLVYKGAGHLIRVPHLPTTVTAFGSHPVWKRRTVSYGGNPRDTAHAAAESWRRVLAFLHEHVAS